MNKQHLEGNYKHICTQQQSPKICEVKTVKLKKKIGNSTIVGNFTALLSITDRTTTQKMNIEIEDLNNS